MRHQFLAGFVSTLCILFAINLYYFCFARSYIFGIVDGLKHSTCASKIGSVVGITLHFCSFHNIANR